MNDQHLVDRAAQDAITAYGNSAASFLRDRAEIAEGIGDAASATAWSEIADAADRLMAEPAATAATVAA